MWKPGFPNSLKTIRNASVESSAVVTFLNKTTGVIEIWLSLKILSEREAGSECGRYIKIFKFCEEISEKCLFVLVAEGEKNSWLLKLWGVFARWPLIASTENLFAWLFFL